VGLARAEAHVDTKVLAGGAPSIVGDCPSGLAKKQALKTDLSNGVDIWLTIEACHPLEGGLIVGDDSAPSGPNPKELTAPASGIVDIIQDAFIAKTTQLLDWTLTIKQAEA
jgi:hypothetical protein